MSKNINWRERKKLDKSIEKAALTANKVFMGEDLNRHRDKQRIKRIIRLIERIWKKQPDLRLCQLIQNCFGKEDIYYYEDDDLERRLREVYKKELGA
jgi:hypothetical protein